MKLGELGTMTGTAAEMTRLTGTVTGVAPVAAIVIVAEYVLAVMPATLTESVVLSPAVPLPGLNVSQAGLEEVAVQLSVPLPPLVMVSIWLDGLEPHWAAVKLKLACEQTIVGPTGPVL